jgi:hypothetical protein
MQMLLSIVTSCYRRAFDDSIVFVTGRVLDIHTTIRLHGLSSGKNANCFDSCINLLGDGVAQLV